MPQNNFRTPEELITQLMSGHESIKSGIKVEAPQKKEEYSSKSQEKVQYDVVWVFALPEERDIAFRALNIPNQNREECIRDHITNYAFTFQQFTLGGLNIAAVTQVSMGMASATSLVTRAILAFRPKLVAMSGICAGRKGKVKIGDLIVADQTYDYTAGKSYVEKFMPKFMPRPMPLPVDSILKDFVVNSIIGHSNIDKLARQPSSMWTPSQPINIYLKSLASGTSVVDDDKTIVEASSIQDNLYGIDMEAYGVALAASSLGTRWIVVKGVQDFADGNKSSSEVDGRTFAAFASAILTGKIIADVVPSLN